MKKLLVFLFALVLFCTNIFCFAESKKYAYACEQNLSVVYNNNEYVLNLSGGCGSVLRNDINKLSAEDKVKVINKILGMGFTLEQALFYVYPNLELSITNLYNSVLINPQEPTVFAGNNDCKIIFKNAKNGVIVDKNALFCDLFDYLKNNKNVKIKTQTIYPKNSLEDVKKQFVLVSTFETDFSTSSEERKNNIKVACAAINGKFIKSGEVFSFNNATGRRNEDSGYKSAKIIENGKYIDGVGGGVCQVSTTLYNACIRAGLSVIEVHNHSLPVAYVQPALDAMVSMGLADLKIKNNSLNDYLITTSSNQDKCRICIYGLAMQYQIKCRSNIYEKIEADDIIETDAIKYGEQYQNGTYRISYGTDGYKAKAYLDYYKDGVLVKSELIRDNTYKAKPGIVLVV